MFQTTPYKLFKLFSAFGSINSITERSTHEYDIEFGTVTDERINRVIDTIVFDRKDFRFEFQELRQLREHDNATLRAIEDRQFRREVVHRALWQAMSEELPLDIAQILQNDGLLSVFNELDLIDLCYISTMGEKFEQMTVPTFQARHRRDEDLLDDLKDDYGIVSLSQVEFCLRKFGASVNELRIDAAPIDTEIILGMCAEYCVNLDSLGIADTACCINTKTYLQQLLPGLQKLCLGARAEKTPMSDIFTGDIALEALDLHLDVYNWTTTSIQLSNVVELSLTSITSGGNQPLSEKILQQISSCCPMLLKCEFNGFFLTRDILTIFPQYLSGIQELTLKTCKYYEKTKKPLAEWRDFRMLQSLKLYDLCAKFAKLLLKTMAMSSKLTMLGFEVKNLTAFLVECITKYLNFRNFSL